MMSSTEGRRIVRAILLAIGAIVLVVLPQVASSRPPLGAGDAATHAGSAATRGHALTVALPMLTERLQITGLDIAEAIELAGMAVDLARRGQSLDDLADKAVVRGGDGPQARDAFDALEAIAASDRLGIELGPEIIAQALGIDLGSGETLGGLHTDSATSSVGLDSLGGGATPKFAGTCLSCPSFDFSLTPTGAWQTHASVTGPPANDCNWYSVGVSAGTTYDFSTCPPDGSAGFVMVMELYTDACVFQTSTIATCGTGTTLAWAAPFSGSVRLKVRGSGGAVGSYTMAYRKRCTGDSTCSSPPVSILPVTDCAVTVGTLQPCSETAVFVADLVAGRTYTFSLCPAECAGAGAGFDGMLQLYDPFGALVASDGAACGNGQIVYTPPAIPGSGPYCILVSRETPGGGDGFGLSAAVQCEPPAALLVGPNAAGTSEPDCTRDQTFIADVSGTGAFDWQWSIAPPAGGSATPGSGTGTTQGNQFQWNSVVQGSGTYQVTVVVTNDCGNTLTTIDYTLEDRAGPLLVITADPVGCQGPNPIRGFQPVMGRFTPGTRARHRIQQQLSTLSHDEMQALMFSSSDPNEVSLRVARRLGVDPAAVRVEDRLDPGGPAPVEAPAVPKAVSCGAPCTGFTTLTAANPFYEVFMTCDNGDYTARTGVAHSVTLAAGGSPQNVIFGGAGGGPGTSNLAWYIHETGDWYQDPTGGEACVFDPPDTATEQNSTGIEAEWTETLLNGVQLRLREEVVAFGLNEPDSGVRLTLGATHVGGPATPVSVGVRWQIDYQNSGDDGPLFAHVECDPFAVTNEISLEHELTQAEIDALDFYRIQNNESPPIFGNFTSSTSIVGWPDTTSPDRLVYARWGNVVNSDWDYITNEGGVGPDSDSATLYYYGWQPANAAVIGPGESFTRSVLIFTASENQDCGDFRAGECIPVEVAICPEECVRIEATATDGCGPASLTFIGASPGAPPCNGNPCVVEFPDEGVFEYTWEATDEVGNSVECSAIITVEDDGNCNQPPTCNAGGPGTSECREAPVEGGSVDDPDGDAIAWSWTSDNPDVTVDPPSGTIPAGAGPRPMPPVIARLSAASAACNASAVLTLTVDDGRGGTSSCATTATFQDDVPPEILGGGGGFTACLWPPNHWYACFTPEDAGLFVVDACSEPVTWSLASCSSDQPDDAPENGWNGDGHTVDDCVMDSDGRSFCVRSERAGTGASAQAGRHYTVSVAATDACGNVSAGLAIATIYVPHDQSPREAGCIDVTQVGCRELPCSP